MRRYPLSDNRSLRLLIGDITALAVDAIVNAAAPELLGGGGVDGAIHQAAGPQLLEACRELPATNGVRCPTGEARITPGFGLRARYVIHTVGPIYAREANPGDFLSRAHKNCLDLAARHGVHSLAFPAISCGVYGFPVREAAKVALAACLSSAAPIEEITFALFSESSYVAFMAAAENLL